MNLSYREYCHVQAVIGVPVRCCVALTSSTPQGDCLASTVFDDFPTFPFKERVDFSQVTTGNVDIVIRQDAGAFRRNVRLGTFNTGQPNGIPVGIAVVGVTGPDRSQFLMHTDHKSESFKLSWTSGEPFSLGAETTAIAFDFGEVSFADPCREFMLLIDSQAGRQHVASRSISDVMSDSTWQIDLSVISGLGMDVTSINEIGITTRSLAAGGTGFSLDQVRLIPEPCSQVLIAEAIFYLAYWAA